MDGTQIRIPYSQSDLDFKKKFQKERKFNTLPLFKCDSADNILGRGAYIKLTV